MKRQFSFRIDIEQILTIDDIWLDGNAPENPTLEDVRKRFSENKRGMKRAAEDWGLLDDLYVDITEMKVPSWVKAQ